jgi:hypothetical protein
MNQPQQPAPEAPQQSPSSNNNGGLSDHQIGELQMAAQAAAAAQHGPSAGKHPNSGGSFEAGDYADKRQRVEDNSPQGQQFSPDYSNYPPVA